MSYATEKIVSLKAAIKKLDPVRDMPRVRAYEGIIKELEFVVAKEQVPIVVHKTVEPEVCESCQ